MDFSWIDLIALPVLGQGIPSLRDGFSYLAFCRQSLATSRLEPHFQPKAAILLPCKGLEEGLERSLEVLPALQYPAYELIFMVESETDGAFSLLTEFCRQNPKLARLVVAGKAHSCGQKVYNLLAGLGVVSAEVEVLAFLDSDAVIGPAWLRNLVAPLADANVGATTGFRWYVPTGGLAGIFRSAWNGSIATALGPKPSSFAWGGSMAIRRDNFARFQVADFWQGAVSDDYALSAAVKQAGASIIFVPVCLVPATGSISWRGLFEFTNRQIIITRVYNPGIFRVLLVWYWFYSLVFLYLGKQAISHLLEQRISLAGCLWLAIIGLSFGKSRLALRAIQTVLGQAAGGSTMARFLYCLIGPLVALLYAINALVAICTRRIVWRGIGYELRSPRETLIFSLEGQPER
ncbi:MAG: glycosyltransferase [Blastocatellia bacterium]|nr:glycosyltransferase [Blastocatellia bacterium]